MERKKYISRLVYRLGMFKVKLLIMSITFFLMTALSFLYPIIVRNITDKGMIEKNISQILFNSFFMFIILLLEQLVNIGQRRLSLSIKNQFQKELYCDIFKKLLSLKMEYFTNKNSAEVINKFSTDINAVTIIADDSIINIANYLLRMVSGSIGLFIIDKRLAILVLAFAPIKLILVMQTSKKKKKYYQQNIENARSFYSWFGEMISGIREIKLWNLYDIKMKDIDKKQKKIIVSNIKCGMMDSYNASGDSALNALLTCILYLVGGWMVCKSELSIGSIVAFISYSMYVTGPITILFNIKYLLSGIYPSAVRLFQFLDLEEEKRNGDILKTGIIQSIRFKDVSYNYGDKLLLKKVTMEIPKGKKVAIIGENGSGKTTILNLLLRFLIPLTGEILINENSIQKYDLNDYRNQFAVVSQDIYLFQDTIANNINMSITV